MVINPKICMKSKERWYLAQREGASLMMSVEGIEWWMMKGEWLEKGELIINMLAKDSNPRAYVSSWCNKEVRAP